jgi:succinate dehydrogenase / fumarate reductase flavoprotein subunit
VLLNAGGQRFMERYDPKRLELSTRDVVARAIHTEVAEGRGTARGGVLLDVSHLSAAKVRQKLPGMYDQFLELAGVDITREPMEVGPTCHYVMGGVRVDADTGASTVPALFACGECSGGMNGANRLGGNSLSDLLVFGRRAGEAAARFADSASATDVDDAEVRTAADEIESLIGDDGEDPYAVEAELQDIMQRRVGIFRDADGLGQALEDLDGVRARVARVRAPGGRAFNPAWNLCRDLHNLLVCAEAITRAALMREESRGAHSRLDHPDYDEDWGSHNIVVRRERDGMRLDRRSAVRVDELLPLVEERMKAELA